MAEPTVSTGDPTGTGPRTLILMRHAAAGSAVRDHDRPLTQDGLRAATEAGRWIRANLPPVDHVICSTATRARQTLSAARVGGEIRYPDELYGGGVDEILEQIASAPAATRTLLVVGHAPTIPSTAWELITQARLNRESDRPGPGTFSTEPAPDDNAVRHFAAGTFAVLTTAAEWAALAGTGADLQAVRHPVH